MPSISKRGKACRIEWVDHNRDRRTVTVNAGSPSRSRIKAEEWLKEINSYVVAKLDWNPPDKREQVKAAALEQNNGPTVHDALAAWVAHHIVRAGDYSSTAAIYDTTGNKFKSWLAETGRNPEETLLGDLTTADLEAWVEWLRNSAPVQKGRTRKDSGIKQYLKFLMVGFRWVAGRQEFQGEWALPDPPEIKWKKGRQKRVPQLQATAKIALAADGWLRQALTVAYYTGLRSSQVMGLRWCDVDLDTGDLHFPGVLGKSDQEREGRTVPLSPHLLICLRAWAKEAKVDLADVGERDDDGESEAPFIVDGALKRGRTSKSPGLGTKRERVIAASTVNAIWKRKKLWKVAYFSPVHCFRSALAQGLVVRGAKIEAVARLLGHSLGVFTLEKYTNPDVSLRDAMCRAVTMIPSLEVAAIDAEQTTPALADVLAECRDEHVGALEALAAGRLPRGRGVGETADLLRALVQKLEAAE